MIEPSKETVSIIENTLEERGDKYGDFEGHSVITQNMKTVMRASRNWADLSPDKKESLEMVAHKIARILNGDPEYHDSWYDIEGYIHLVSVNLEKEKSDDK